MVDLSKPHIARVVDYWLGGSHHYSVDREAAKMAEKDLPDLPQFQIRHRAFLKRAYAYLVMAAGLNKFVDFGSGLPTQGNVHEVVLEFDPDCRIIYSDYDTEVVQYGQEIVEATHPDQVRYVYCDGARPEDLIHSDMLDAFFEGDRRVGFGYTNMTHLVPDEALKAGLELLYGWAAPGSHLVVSYVNPDVRQYPHIYQAVQWQGQDRWYRTDEEVLDVLGPWEITEHGITYSTSWPKNTKPDGPLTVAHKGFVARKL